MYLLYYTNVFTTRQEYATMGPVELQTKPIVAKTTETQTMLLDSNTGSLQFFVYPLPFQRTGALSVCSSTSEPGDPSCTTARYGICVCTGTDCTSCAHSGFVNVVNISNVIRLELLAAPDAGRQEAAAAQLVVRCKRPLTTGSGMETVEETMVLPELPYQKWTMVTLAREGRRLDISYNDKLVLSKRTQNMIDTTLATGQIIAGDAALYGHIAFVQVFANKLTATEITDMYKSLADTTGKPNLPTDTKDFASLFSLCKDGSCLQGPSFRPSSPFLDWDTKYD